MIKQDFRSSEQSKTTSAAASDLFACKVNPISDGLSGITSAFVQPDLTVGSSGGIQEKEADAISDKVMRMETAESVCFSGGSSLQRKCDECLREEVRRKESNTGASSFIAPPIVNNVLSSSEGKSLNGHTRAFMEPRFNYDFSKVKIHDNDLAAKSASSINALAYTSGNNIVFHSGQYNTNSDSGKRLMAHELTHVVQQADSIQRKIIQRQESTDDVEEPQSGFSDDSEQLQARPSTPLQVGNVVRVEVRNGPTVEEMTNNYPVSPNGCLNLPMVGCIVTRGKTTTQIRAEIEQALRGGFLTSPTVNVSLINKTIDYTHAVQPGESIFIRVLGASGNVEFEGDFPVDSNGQIHVPMAGDMTVQGKNFASIEAEVTKALLNGFLRSTTVHVADKKI